MNGELVNGFFPHITSPTHTLRPGCSVVSSLQRPDLMVGFDGALENRACLQVTALVPGAVPYNVLAATFNDDK